MLDVADNSSTVTLISKRRGISRGKVFAYQGQRILALHRDALALGVKRALRSRLAWGLNAQASERPRGEVDLWSSSKLRVSKIRVWASFGLPPLGALGNAFRAVL